MNYATDFKSLKGKVSDEEWQARVELAACYRLVDSYEMTDLIYNHITSRIPGTHHLLINLYGLLYKEITASSLVKIDVEGEIIDKPDTDPQGAAGGEVHSAHPHPGRHRGLRHELWAAAAVADFYPLPRAHRLPRLRRPGG